MSRLKDLNVVRPAYTEEELQGLVAYCKGFLDITNQLLGQVSAKSSCWPTYVWEEVSYYEITPPNPLAQDIFDLSTDIGNINLRLQALLHAMDEPVIK